MELLACRDRRGMIDAYDRLLSDAMLGDPLLVRAPGRSRAGLAHRRSGARRAAAARGVRAGHVGAGRGRSARRSVSGDGGRRANRSVDARPPAPRLRSGGAARGGEPPSKLFEPPSRSAASSRSRSRAATHPGVCTSGSPPTPSSIGRASSSSGAMSGRCLPSIRIRTSAWPMRPCCARSGSIRAGSTASKAERGDLAAAARDYEEELAKICGAPDGRPPILDLVLLGMGADGHTASLFPYTAALSETRRWVVANDVPQLSTRRITITFPLIERARSSLVLVTGASKSDALAEVLEGPLDPERLPESAPARDRRAWIGSSMPRRRAACAVRARRDMTLESYALDQVRPGHVLGLGSGRAAERFVRALGARVAAGLEVRGVPTSRATADLARALGIPLVSLDDAPRVDLAVDGADEVDPEGRLIKGYGGALLREKIVAAFADRVVDPRRAREMRPAPRHARSAAGRGVAVRAGAGPPPARAAGSSELSPAGRRSPAVRATTATCWSIARSARYRIRASWTARSTESPVCSRRDCFWTSAR